MSTLDWNDVDPRPEGSGNGGQGGKSKFLNLKPGEYKIRPVGPPKEVRRYFVQNGGERKFAITGEKDDKCVIMRKYRDADGQPLYPQRTRYAFNCIDRADGQLKIIEVPATVARAIRNWGIENNINPGGGKGVDFKIKVIRQGPDPRNTKYEVVSGLQTPFTDDEKAMLEKQGIYDLDDIFKPVAQSEIEAALGLTSGGSSGKSSNSDDEDFAPRASNSGKSKAAATVAVEEDDIAF